MPGTVTKLVPFGAFVRVDEGIEGLVHISELAERHVEIPEQVVQVGTEIFVKVIDIDLERRRISLSLKQANEGAAETVEFDPTLYGMAATYDDQGNYVYPDGFDPETGEWKPRLRASSARSGSGSTPRRRSASRRTRSRWTKPRRPTRRPPSRPASTPSTYSSETVSRGGRRRGRGCGGSLASDEALAALREKLTGAGE